MTNDAELASPNLRLDLPGGIGVRQYRETDVQSISRNANNKNVAQFLRDRFPVPYTEESARTWMEIVSREESMARSGPWTMERGSEGPLVITNYAVTVNDEAVGSIGLEFGKDVYFRTAELGYWLGEDHWGQGIMSKVVPPFINWAWDTFGVMVRVNAEVSARNLGSASVLKKAGLVFEGRRANAYFKKGVLDDLLIFGALRPT